MAGFSSYRDGDTAWWVTAGWWPTRRLSGPVPNFTVTHGAAQQNRDNPHQDQADADRFDIFSVIAAIGGRVLSLGGA